MTQHVRNFLQQHHVRIWQTTAILAYEKDQKNRIIIKTVAANSISILSVCYWLSMLLALLFSDVDEKVFTSSILIFTMLASIKYCLFRCQSDRLTETVGILTTLEKCTSHGDQIEQQLVTSAVALMRWIAVANIILSVCCVIMRLVSCYVYGSENRELIVHSWLPAWMDWQHQDWIFLICILWQLLSILYFVFVSATLDFYGPSLFIFLNCFLAILDKRLRNIGWKSNSVRLFRNELMSCLRFHRMCLK